MISTLTCKEINSIEMWIGTSQIQNVEWNGEE
jgi:hypothetical protein